MNNEVRDKLKDLINKFGTSLSEDEGKLRAILKDVLNKEEHLKQVNILLLSVREGITRDLNNNSIPAMVLIPQLIKRLTDNLGMEQSNAQWVVETWAYAFGIKYQKNASEIEIKNNTVSLDSLVFQKIYLDIQNLINHGNFSQAIQIINEQELKETNPDNKLKLYNLKIELENKKLNLLEELEKEFKNLEVVIIPSLLKNKKYFESNEILKNFIGKAYKVYEPDSKENEKFIFSQNISKLQEEISKSFAKSEIKNLEIDIEKDLSQNDFDNAKNKLQNFENKLHSSNITSENGLIEWDYISQNKKYYISGIEVINNKINQSFIDYSNNLRLQSEIRINGSNTSNEINIIKNEPNTSNITKGESNNSNFIKNKPSSKLIISGLIVTICLIFTIPIYNNHIKLEKRSIVKRHMHSLQTILETYAIDHEGIYPKNIEELFKEAKDGNYWKEMKNPYGNNLSHFGNYGDITIKGIIIYQPTIKDYYNITNYKIFGYDEENHSLKDKNNSDLVFTNE